MLQLVLLGVTLNTIALVTNIVIVCAATYATESLRNRAGLQAALDRALGVVFIVLGMRLASERL